MHKLKGEPLGRIIGSPMHYFPSALSPSVDPPFTLHRGQFYGDGDSWSFLDAMIFSELNNDNPENTNASDVSMTASQSNPPSLATPDREPVPVPDSPYRESFFVPSNPNVTPPPAHSPFKYVRKGAYSWINLDPDLI